MTVIGLDNFARLEPLAQRCTSAPKGPPKGSCAPPDGVNTLGPPTNDYGYSPAQLRDAYTVSWLTHSGLCATCDGSGQEIGLLEFGSFPSTSNEQTFDSAYGLSPPATITHCTDSSGCPTDAAVEPEADLDLQVVHAIAPKAQAVVYDNSDEGLVDMGGLLAELEDVLNPPKGVPATRVNSISYGTCETDASDSTLKGIDQEFAMLAASDHTFFAASGDSGKHCGGPDGPVGANFPASDPYVTAVGGTNLLLNTDNSYAVEYAWSESGGGASSVFARPSWQAGPGVPSGPATCGKKNNQPCRLVPDVSADAYAGGS